MQTLIAANYLYFCQTAIGNCYHHYFYFKIYWILTLGPSRKKQALKIKLYFLL